jgi:choline kinase
MRESRTAVPRDEQARTCHCPESAVILVAGMGTRLSGSFDQPKCLVPIEGRSILERQLLALAKVGVRRAVLVAGHRAAMVEERAREMCARLAMELVVVHNPAFAETNTAASMACAAEVLAQGAFTLNGDVVFDAAILEALVAAPGESAVVVDDHPCGAEEVKVRLDDEGRVLQMGKWLDPAQSSGEFIGIARFGAAHGAAFGRELLARCAAPEWRKRYYDDVLHDLAVSFELRGVVLHGLPMVEVDFPEDLERARTLFAVRR